MPGQTSEDLLSLFDRAPLNRALLGRFRDIGGGYGSRVLRFLGRGVSAGRGRAAMAPDLRPVGPDPLQRRRWRDPGRADLRCAVRRLGTQGADDHRHLHLRFRRGVDRVCPRRRLAALWAAALCRRHRADGGGGPGADDRRRADADAPSHGGDELLCRVCNRGRACRFGDRGGTARRDRLARHGHARHRGRGSRGI